MITLSVKSSYALSAMVEIGLVSESGSIQTRDIAKNASIPHTYLEQLLVSLKKSGLIQSFRGSKGGYRLAVSSRAITVWDVLTSVEGESMVLKKNLESNILKEFWESVDQGIEAVFQTPLSELIQKVQQERTLLTYHI